MYEETAAMPGKSHVIASVPEVARMAKPQLVQLWKELFGAAPPEAIRRDLLVRFVAYRLQEHAYGGLTQQTKVRLLELARRIVKDPEADLIGSLQIKPGTCLVRDWRGQSHRVLVLNQGYEYEQKKFASLSQIARLITGTRWSGPLFFGLRRAHQGKGDQSESVGSANSLRRLHAKEQ
jgi:hypothetical protein